MFQLPSKPTKPITQDMTSHATGKILGSGVIGVQCPNGPTVSFFPEALAVLQFIQPELGVGGQFHGIKVALASSSEEPSYSRACLEKLDIFPGVPFASMVDYSAIGRTGGLTSRKTTHFNKLKGESGIEPNECLFFDDW